MTTIWTDSEYARVAEALRYPGYIPSLLGVGFNTETLELTRRLREACSQLPPEGKARALQMADQIRALVDRFTDVNSDSDVIQVDRIKFDPSVGFSLLERRIDYQRGLLADYVGVKVNVNGEGSGNTDGVCTQCYG